MEKCIDSIEGSYLWSDVLNSAGAKEPCLELFNCKIVFFHRLKACLFK